MLSQRAGVELASNLLDRDATEEWEAVQAEATAARDQMVNEFSGTPGEDDNVGAPPAPGAIEVELAPTDKIKSMTVNEVRKTMKLGQMMMPDGSRDPEGDMKWVEFIAKLEAAGAAQGEVEGTVEGSENAGVDDDLPQPAPQLLPRLPSE